MVIFLRTVFIILVTTYGSSVLQAGWTPSAINVSGTIGFERSSIQIDSAGNAIAVWISRDRLSVIGGILPANASIWEVNPIFTAGTNQKVVAISLAVAPSGEAVVVWGYEQGVSPLPVIGFVSGASLLSGSTTWSVPMPIDMQPNGIDSISVDVDASGNAVAVWTTSPTDFTIHGATLAFSNDWGLPFEVIPPGTDIISLPSVIVDASRNAVIMWLSQDSVTSTFSVQSRTLFGNATGPILVANSVANEYLAEGDSAGNVVAIFRVGPTITGAKLLSNASAWVPTSELTSSGVSPSLAMNSRGDAVAIWANEDGVIQGAFLPAGSLLWVNTVDLSGPNNVDPSVAIDALGNAYADWLPDLFADPEGVVQAAILPFGTQVWREVATLTHTIALHFASRIVINPSGTRAIALWIDFNFESLILQSAIGTSLFPQPVPPFNFRGRVVPEEFLLQTGFFNRLTWTPSPDPSVVAYRLRRNGVLIATIPASGPFVFDSRRRGGRTYTLVSVSDLGVESVPVSVTIR